MSSCKINQSRIRRCETALSPECDDTQNFKRYQYRYFSPVPKIFTADTEAFSVPIYADTNTFPVPIFWYRYLLSVPNICDADTFSVPKMHDTGSDTFKYKQKYRDRYRVLNRQRMLKWKKKTFMKPCNPFLKNWPWTPDPWPWWHGWQGWHGR